MSIYMYIFLGVESNSTVLGVHIFLGVDSNSIVLGVHIFLGVDSNSRVLGVHIFLGVDSNSRVLGVHIFLGVDSNSRVLGVHIFLGVDSNYSRVLGSIYFYFKGFSTPCLFPSSVFFGVSPCIVEGGGSYGSRGCFPILFNHRSCRKPALFPGFWRFSKKQDPWKESGQKKRQLVHGRPT